MAVQQLTLPGEIVKKHNKLVRSRILNTSTQTSRILASIVACVHTDDTEFKDVYSVPIKDFLPYDSGRGYKYFKAACEELSQTVAEFEEPDPDSGIDPRLILRPFFTEIRYHNGIVKAQFNPTMRPYLLQLRRCFTEYALMEYLTLPSTYSQRLFEILKSWANTPEVILQIAELHRLLDTPESLRNDFAQFRRWVLEKAHKDIHEKTSLRYEWEPVKAGRSVESIRFLFAPGRKALAEAEQQKVKEAKRRRLQKQRLLKAVECSKSKGGECITQDNKRLVCKVCRELDVCCSPRPGH